VSLKAPRGTQDILPDRTPAWHWLESRFRDTLHRYGYGEIRTPIFEHTELFQRGVGEATDIVQKEMYTFLDRKGRSLTLRPEGTAPVARAFAEHKLYAGGGTRKLYYLGPMFRYERPQAGRFRQHQQIGAELLGTEVPEADVEVISLLVDLLASVGLARTSVLVNSVGDAVCRPAYSESLRTYLRAHQSELCPDCVRRTESNPLRVLDCKVPGCRKVAKNIPSIQDALCAACREHQERVLDLLQSAGIRVDLSSHLVRGLDYYTRTVFEVQHEGLGAQNAVGGGGRYDHLVSEVGGPPVPGVGFSTGVERILLALEAEGVDLPVAYPPQVVIVTAGSGAEIRQGVLLARRLRGRFRVEMDLLGRSLNAQMKAAHRLDARTVIVVGAEELASGEWTVRDMGTSRQDRVADADLEEYLDGLLAPRA